MVLPALCLFFFNLIKLCLVSVRSGVKGSADTSVPNLVLQTVQQAFILHVSMWTDFCQHDRMTTVQDVYLAGF